MKTFVKMSDAWDEIQAIKSKRNILRERLEKRKKERQDILGTNLGSTSSPVSFTESPSNSLSGISNIKEEVKTKTESTDLEDLVKVDPELETQLLKTLSEVTLQLPLSSTDLLSCLKPTTDKDASHKQVCNLLYKFATQRLITVNEAIKDGSTTVEVTLVEVSKVNAMIVEFADSKWETKPSVKRKRDELPMKSSDNDEDKKKKEKKEPKADIMVCWLFYIL